MDQIESAKEQAYIDDIKDMGYAYCNICKQAIDPQTPGSHQH